MRAKSSYTGAFKPLGLPEINIHLGLVVRAKVWHVLVYRGLQGPWGNLILFVLLINRPVERIGEYNGANSLHVINKP